MCHAGPVPYLNWSLNHKAAYHNHPRRSNNKHSVMSYSYNGCSANLRSSMLWEGKQKSNTDLKQDKIKEREKEKMPIDVDALNLD